MKFLFITAIVLFIATSVLAQGQMVVGEGLELQSAPIVEFQIMPVTSATVAQFSVLPTSSLSDITGATCGLIDTSVFSINREINPITAITFSANLTEIQVVPEPSPFALGVLAVGIIAIIRKFHWCQVFKRHAAAHVPA